MSSKNLPIKYLIKMSETPFSQLQSQFSLLKIYNVLFLNFSNHLFFSHFLYFLKSNLYIFGKLYISILGNRLLFSD